MYLKHNKTTGPLVLILLVVFFVMESNEESANVGVVIRLTQNGLTYAMNTILESIKKVKLSTFSIPTANVTTSHVNYSIQNLTYTDYANLNASILINKTTGLSVTIDTLSVNASGKVECRDKDERYCPISIENLRHVHRSFRRFYKHL
ncbi:uncharacterized protein LOC133178613 [Saccostrea echinata]|uniref:uncharacterized protein LOC133178613 n=1 Tax=Saccostrea echinata TaxID=191078 RepID=UPI002A7EC08F|nr:uncharacterized protein LOC133178613 [Saccostrea echinata]